MQFLPAHKCMYMCHIKHARLEAMFTSASYTSLASAAPAGLYVQLTYKTIVQ